MTKRWRSLAYVFTALLCVLLSPAAHALSLIRDAEIEDTLRRYANPIFKEAGLNPKSVRIFIVNENVINAYVAGGANIFLYTGLIDACTTPGMLIGTIAHETGHIAGGHLARGTEKLKNAQIGAILTYVLGAAAGVSAGQGDVAAAVIAGGQNVLQRNLLSFSRGNEQAADQAALRYLDGLQASASGLYDLMSMLRRSDAQHLSQRDPYILTHPLTSERMSHVGDHVEHSPFPADKLYGDFEMPHQRMRAKLYSFLNPPEKTFARYPERDTSLPARLARAVAYYKMPDVERALNEIDGLLKEHPKDAYLYDLKGQVLFENGHIEDARKAYEKAVSLLPDSPLILASLGEVEVATGQPEEFKNAIRHLEKSTQLDATNANVWRILATAYGKRGELGKSSLALAEEAAIKNDHAAITRFADQAMRQLTPGTPAYQRAIDLKNLALQLKEKAKD